MAGPISQYWASVGIRTDEKDLKKVDDYLRRIESRLSKTTGKKGLQVNLFVDEAKFHKHLQGVMNRVGKSSPLKLANVTIDPAAFSKSVRETLAKAQFKAPISAIVTRVSLQNVRAQVAAVLQGLPINIRVGNVSSRGVSNRGGDGSESVRRRASLTGRGDPSLQEFLMGRPDKSSLSAGNRRYLDAIVGKATGGVGASPLSRMAIQGGVGGLARLGGGSILGRAAGMAGLAFGGPVGGTLGLAAGGIMSMAGTAFTSIWSGLGKVITLPFQAISGAASAVTGAFYRIALAAAPLVMGFNYVNRFVQKESQQQIALNTVSKSLGSSGQAERGWLMNMSNRDGMRYDALIEPYTSFIASASPAMGLGMAKNVFEAFTQFGMTRGANNVSMGLAMKAVSQMAGKGKIQAEEMRGQLGDAPGFGEMQGIFAQAYQRSLGRTGADAKQGQKAIEELNAAMEKGNVISSKVLPFVAEIAKQMAAGGIDEARMSSFAQQNRFMNQMREGRDAFRTGGGEQGIAFFWQMMQKMGAWWVSNGSTVGRYFHAAMVGLDGIRLGLMELWQFASTGKPTAITDWLKGHGLDVDALRDAMIRLRDAIKQLLGIESNKVGDILTEITNRLIIFINNLSEIAKAAARVASGVNDVKEVTVEKYSRFNADTPAGKTKTIFGDLASQVMWATGFDNTVFGKVLSASNPSLGGGLRKIIGGTTDATMAATEGLYNLGTGGGTKPKLIPDTPGTFKPEGWDTRFGDVSPYARSPLPSQQNLNVTLDVKGNAEVLGALMDERAKAAFPVMLSNEIAKQVVNAPISGSR